MTIIIPSAGLGKRFHTDTPKPLLEVVDGKPMLQVVLENIAQDPSHRVIVTILQEHDLKHNLADKILSFANVDVKILPVLTDGPACTVAQTIQACNVNRNDELIVTNCDQVIEDFNMSNFLRFCHRNNYDGVIGTFFCPNAKNSFVKMNDRGLVTEAREKQIISEYATNGFHYWKYAGDFEGSFFEMIEAHDTAMGEYYISHSYNYLIQDGKRIGTYHFNEHYPIGIPEDLEKYRSIKNG